MTTKSKISMITIITFLLHLVFTGFFFYLSYMLNALSHLFSPPSILEIIIVAFAHIIAILLLTSNIIMLIKRDFKTYITSVLITTFAISILAFISSTFLILLAVYLIIFIPITYIQHTLSESEFLESL